MAVRGRWQVTARGRAGGRNKEGGYGDGIHRGWPCIPVS